MKSGVLKLVRDYFFGTDLVEQIEYGQQVVKKIFGAEIPRNNEWDSNLRLMYSYVPNLNILGSIGMAFTLGTNAALSAAITGEVLRLGGRIITHTCNDLSTQSRRNVLEDLAREENNVGAE